MLKADLHVHGDSHWDKRRKSAHGMPHSDVVARSLFERSIGLCGLNYHNAVEENAMQRKQTIKHLVQELGGDVDIRLAIEASVILRNRKHHVSIISRAGEDEIIQRMGELPPMSIEKAHQIRRDTRNSTLWILNHPCWRDTHHCEVREKTIAEIGDNLELFDAVEILNGAYMNGNNTNAKGVELSFTLADLIRSERINIPLVGSSDAHRPEDVGSAFSLFLDSDVDDILTRRRSNDVIATAAKTIRRSIRDTIDHRILQRTSDVIFTEQYAPKKVMKKRLQRKRD